jgi:photosystem II stability/assembly factor-like uncharacterized protein
MKTLHSHCASVLAAVGLSAFAAGAGAGLHEWSAIGPVGADIRVLAVDGANLYAGTAIGMLTSRDRGARWTVASDGLADAYISALAIDVLTPSTLYAGTPAGGLFKSVDAGTRWFAVDAGLPKDAAGAYVSALATHPERPGAVYAATSQGLFMSADGASTWTTSRFRRQSVASIAFDPNVTDTIYLTVEDYSGMQAGAYRSVDAGANWTKIRGTQLDPFGDSDAGRVLVDSQSRLYVSYYGSNPIASHDGGTTWSALHLPFPALDGITALAVDDTDSRLLYVGTWNGRVFASSDAGKTWTAATTLSAATNALHASKGAVLAATRRGLSTSPDAGKTWAALDLGVRRVEAASVTIDPVSPSTTYVTAVGVPIKTTDAGLHWSDLGIASAVARIVPDARSPSTLYALTDRAIYKSTDAGNQWTPLATGIIEPTFAALAIARSRPSTLYAGVHRALVIKSTDGGTTWSVANHGLVGDFALDKLVVDAVDPDVVIAARGRQLFRSLDGGTNSQAMSLPAFTALIGAIAIDPASSSTYYVALNAWDGVAGGVLKTTDAGASWSHAEAGIPRDVLISAFAFDPSDRHRLYVATTAGVFRSVDAAATWAPLNTHLPDRVVLDLALDASGKVLRAGTTSGLFEYRFANDASDMLAVLEYHHQVFDHYFIPANTDDIANLDNGVISGWSRTGLVFNAFAKASSAAVPVCRFFGTAFAPKSSHFYSPFDAECTKVRGDGHWQLETAEAFAIALPSPTGACASGSMPVYRLYNDGRGGAPNHRCTTDEVVRSQMIAQGWVPEGIGPDAVQMCAPL